MSRKPPHVVLAVPTYDGKIFMGTMKAIVQDTLLMMAEGWNVSFQSVMGSADIYDARANMCHEFLQGKGTHLVMVDSDVAWKQGAVVRLVKHDVDMVAGVYPRRTEPFSYNLQYLPGQEGKLVLSEKKLCEVAGVSAGFMALKRRCLERLAEAYRDDPVAGLAHRATGTYVCCFDPYRFKDDPQRKLGEDYAFCQRWRDIGGRVWIDPFIPMAHIGQKTYAATLSDWMQHDGKAEQAGADAPLLGAHPSPPQGTIEGAGGPGKGRGQVSTSALLASLNGQGAR